MHTITFDAQEKAQLVTKIKTYFAKELDSEIGGFDAEFLLEFFTKELGARYYNQGLYDGLESVKSRFETLSDDVSYALEKEVSPS